MHTTISDGRRSLEEALRIYRDAGYDAVAVTDHWIYGAGGSFEGMTILSGAEYNTKTQKFRTYPRGIKSIGRCY